MPWTGNGTFRRTNGPFQGEEVWKQSAAAGHDVSSEEQDTHDQDVAGGLENCIARDGQNRPTADLPMGGHKHTGCAKAANDDEYATLGQLRPQVAALQDGAVIAWDVTNRPQAKVTLRGNREFAAPVGGAEGGVYVLTIEQDGTGGRTATWDNAYKFGVKGPPALSAGAGKEDTLVFYFVNGEMRLQGVATGF
jgi:hypothetical protein